MSQPDLFVVCKNCGSEVSPYVTECPYCGQRVRKRAPKIDRSSGEPSTKRRRRAKKLPRLRAEEIAGIAPETRPVRDRRPDPRLRSRAPRRTRPTRRSTSATCSSRAASTTTGGAGSPRPSCTATSSATRSSRSCRSGIFGTLLERRFGPVPVVLIFILSGAAGAALAAQLETPPLLSDVPIWPVIGANGAALGLLCAWLVDDRLAFRRGEDRENDLLGVYIIAAVLVLLSLTTEEANIAAAVGGALTGSVIGLLLPRLTRNA